VSANVRISDELYEALREIRLSLESRHQSSAPTIQDMVSVAVKRLITTWQVPEDQAELLAELLENRHDARSRMGRNRKND
jgi:hypothetical protein